ncbi:hypothetical protein [Natrinema caseinilyticum]|uniref:hypothetical protein n=1 Tax=Natrinema caseinilyticum TaxID=2961570 RepID=UPI0020C43434|nr:hypothetical protein [Natrinema caseinilyticum]
MAVLNTSSIFSTLIAIKVDGIESHSVTKSRSTLLFVWVHERTVVRLSTIVILVGIVRFTPLPPPLGILLGVFLILLGTVLRVFTDR